MTAITLAVPRLSVQAADSKSKSTPGAAPTKTANSVSPVNQSASAGSAAVSLVAAAIKEATETSAQTAKEAAGGDRQAQNLLAKAAAAQRSGNLTSAAAGLARADTVGTHIDVKA